MRGNCRRSPRRALIEMGMRLLNQPDVHPRRWQHLNRPTVGMLLASIPSYLALLFFKGVSYGFPL